MDPKPESLIFYLIFLKCNTIEIIRVIMVAIIGE